MSGKGEIVHNILNDKSDQPDAFGCCHFVCFDHWCCELDTVEGFGSVKHHSWEKTQLNINMITWTKVSAKVLRVFSFFSFSLSVFFKHSTYNFFKFYSLVVSSYFFLWLSSSLTSLSCNPLVLSTYFSFLLAAYWSTFF